MEKVSPEGWGCETAWDKVGTEPELQHPAPQTPVILTLEKSSLDCQKFKIVLRDRVSLRLAWAIWSQPGLHEGMSQK